MWPWHDILGKYTALFYLICKSRFFWDIPPTSPSVEPSLSPHSFSSPWFVYQLVVFSKLHWFISFLTFFSIDPLYLYQYGQIPKEPIFTQSQLIMKKAASKHTYFLLRKGSPYFKLFLNSMSHVVCTKGWLWGPWN